MAKEEPIRPMAILRPVGYYDQKGKSHCGEPSLQNVVSETAHADEEKIAHYLETGVGVAGCGGVSRDILDRAAEVYLNLDAYSDGVWHWPADLVYYVRKYHARLPEEFVTHMRANSWVVPDDHSWVDNYQWAQP